MSRRARRGGEDSADDSNPLEDATWLYSYADLMTQLLLFAVLMVTVGGLKPPKKPEEPAVKADPRAEAVRALDQLVQQANMKDAVAIDRGADRLVVRMKSKLLFGEGQANLGAQAEVVLGELVQLLAKLPQKVRVEGHTDDVPMRSEQFPSNWELSSARAISVVRYLEEHGVDRQRLSAAGYGEFHPIAANDGAERRSLNRRVELVLLGE